MQKVIPIDDLFASMNSHSLNYIKSDHTLASCLDGFGLSADDNEHKLIHFQDFLFDFDSPLVLNPEYR